MKREKATVTLSYDEERLAALRLYLAEKKTQVEAELLKSLDALYGKTVPQNVRYYIAMRNGESPSTPKQNQTPGDPSQREEVKRDGE